MSLINLIIQINIHSTDEEKISQNNDLDDMNIHFVCFNDTKELCLISRTLLLDQLCELFNCLNDSHLYYNINSWKNNKSLNFYDEWNKNQERVNDMIPYDNLNK